MTDENTAADDETRSEPTGAEGAGDDVFGDVGVKAAPGTGAGAPGEADAGTPRGSDAAHTASDDLAATVDDEDDAST
ncbi:MAG: hypothetical protein ACRCYR_19170 [Phycicoccus sp.]